MRSEILLTLSILNKKNGPENSGCMTDLNMVFKLGSWNPGVPWSNQGITEKFRWKRQHGASVLLPDKASQQLYFYVFYMRVIHFSDWKKRFHCLQKELKNYRKQNKKFHTRNNTCKDNPMIV